MKRTTTARIISFSLAAILVAGGFAIRGQQEAAFYRRQLHYGYLRSMSELVDSMSQISGSLQKGQYASSPTLLMSLSAEIWRESYTAKNSVSQMPFADIQLDRTSRFISQVGDFAFNVAKKAANHERLSDEEIASIEELARIADGFTLELSNLKNDIYEGNVRFASQQGIESEAAQAGAAQGDQASGTLEKLEEEFPEYATLIYDGPLSDHIDKLEPALISHSPGISIDEAKARAAQFVSLQPSDLVYAGEGGDKIKTYSFTSQRSGQMYIEICKAGGYILNMSTLREDTPEAKLSAEEAVERAVSFLAANGYPTMKESYYIETDGVLIINFAYQQDDVVVYPDLIKVGVALDNGEIVRFESRGYVMSHKTREVPKPAVSEADAKNVLDRRLTVQTSNMAIIPTDGQNEALCYEFLCEAQNGQRLIVYVNAETGAEQRIFVLLEEPNGTLTL